MSDQPPLVFSHPQASHDIEVAWDEDGGQFVAWIADLAVIGEGDTPGAAIRDAHMALTIMAAMLAPELGR